MSMFIIFHLNHLPHDKSVNLTDELRTIATENNFGVWFDNRYIEEFEQKRAAANPDLFAFDVADDFEFDNCEDILEPWWFDGNSEKPFNTRIGFIEKIADCCLRYTDSVELFIASSGVFFEDEFNDYNTHPDEIISVLRHHYSDLNEVEPCLHFTLTTK